MKKLFATLALTFLAFGMAVAQQTKTITGYVVDKNGNPLAGAEVMATGGGASAMTDADGSFTLQVHPLLKKITASYAGMGNKTLKLNSNSDYVFTMKPEKKHPGFISAIGAVGYDMEDDGSNYLIGGFGLMGGQLGKWGWYAKAQLLPIQDADFGVTAGAIKQLGKSKTYLYFGAGLQLIDYTEPGLGVDFGTIIQVHPHINIIAGLNYCYGSYLDYYEESITCNVFNVNVGVGYVF